MSFTYALHGFFMRQWHTQSAMRPTRSIGTDEVPPGVSLENGVSTMRRVIALALGILMPALGVTGVGQAQSTSAVQVQGVIEAVDCQSGTIQLSNGNGTSTIYAAPYTTALVGTTSVPFCSLGTYVGAPAAIWVVPDSGQFSAAQIVVTGPVAAGPVATPSISPVPITGVVLGTVVVAGLVYLLVHGPDGGYYRYPYYGPYYRFYYHAGYRPYTGFYPATAPVITVAPALVGVVLGIVIVNDLQYILTQDAGGHYYRYPYYGPYRQYYYRATYRPYTGPYRAYQSTPVRQGDAQWDGQAHVVAQFNNARSGHAATLPATVHPSAQPAPRGGQGTSSVQRSVTQVQGAPRGGQGTPSVQRPVTQVQGAPRGGQGTPSVQRSVTQVQGAPRGGQGTSSVQRPVTQMPQAGRSGRNNQPSQSSSYDRGSARGNTSGSAGVGQRCGGRGQGQSCGQSGSSH